MNDDERDLFRALEFDLAPVFTREEMELIAADRNRRHSPECPSAGDPTARRRCVVEEHDVVCVECGRATVEVRGFDYWPPEHSHLYRKCEWCGRYEQTCNATADVVVMRLPPRRRGSA